MDSYRLKHLVEKAIDFKRFAHVLLLVSVFLYFGVLLGQAAGHKEEMQFLVMLGAIAAFLGASAFFYSRSRKISNEIAEETNNEA